MLSPGSSLLFDLGLARQSLLGPIAIIALMALGSLYFTLRRKPVVKPRPKVLRTPGDWLSRKEIFKPGGRYRVREGVEDSRFASGDVLIFEDTAYSHYDNTHFYRFTIEGNGKTTWTLHDDEPCDGWKRFFEALA
jgi:hypothetical protein